MEMRIQKYLALRGVCSRRHAEEMILEGRVRVNNFTVRELGVKINPEKDIVAVGKRVITRKDKKAYLAVNKPKGVITSCSSEQGVNITSLVTVPERVYPAGRLDKDSTGLVLLTNDGELAERLMHPRYAHEKEYIVEHTPALEAWAYGRLAKGVRLPKTVTQAAEVTRESEHRFRIVLREGRYHQVRRMCEALGTKVTTLKRVRIGPLRLGRLAPGAWRRLTRKEVEALRAAVGLGEGKDAGCRMQDAGCRMQDAGGRMQEAGGRMQDAGCRMPDAGCRMQDAGCRMPDGRGTTKAPRHQGRGAVEG